MNKNSQQPLAIEIATSIEAEISALPPIMFRGIKVLTTELVAQFFCCEEVNIRKNFSTNKNRFEEEKHYFLLDGADLKDFFINQKDTLCKLPIVTHKNISKIRSLILWTERGTALLAKILDTDQAWNVIDKLVNVYFNAQEKFINLDESKLSLKYSLKFISDEAIGAKNLAKVVGLKGNQATLSACQMIRKLYDIDILSLTGQTKGLTSESQQHDFSPTEIGGMLKPVQSARKVNLLLIELGYQTRVKNPKLNRAVYQVTELGKSFAILKDTTKKRSDGTPILQVRWFEKIVEFLQSRVVI